MLTTEEIKAIHRQVIDLYLPIINADKFAIYERESAVVPADQQPTGQISWPVAEFFLQSLGPVPDFSLCLGMCLDGLPLMLDLHDPGVGSLLITQKDTQDVNYLFLYLQKCFLMLPELARAEVYSISNQHHQVFDETHPALLAPESDKVFKLIYLLAEEIESRRNGRSRTTPPITVFIENLTILTQYFDDETTNYLGWIIQEGGPVNVRVMGFANPKQSGLVKRRILPLFRHLVKTQSYLRPGEQPHYSTRMGNETIYFSLAVLEA